jgi:tellurite resistance protein TerC
MSPWLWGGFIAAVVVMLALDLGIFHRRAHAVSVREALLFSAGWIALSLLFNLFIAARFGTDAGLDFLTAYLIEKSLSIDNLFAFVVVFATFRIPPQGQHRVLFWGIFGALALRAVLIIGGTALLHRFAWLVFPLGFFLLVSGVKVFADRNRDETAEPGKVTKWLEQRFGGSNKKLWLALIAVELTDLVFAVDSVPAALAITDETFIVFTSNVCAMLGLRSLYFALAGLLTRFKHLKTGLAAILSFVGVKMLLSHVVSIPHGLSLAVIAAILALSVIASLSRARVAGQAR